MNPATKRVCLKERGSCEGEIDIGETDNDAAGRREERAGLRRPNVCLQLME